MGVLRVGLTAASTALLTGWLSAPQALAAIPTATVASSAASRAAAQDRPAAVVLPGPVAPGRPPLTRPVAPDVPAPPVAPQTGRVHGPVVPVTPRNPFLALVLADGSTPPPTRTPTSVPGAAAGDRLLRAGSRGVDVRRLQEQLSARGQAVQPDGVYGAVTAAAVRELQRRAGLADDGVVGPLTRGVLQTG